MSVCQLLRVLTRVVTGNSWLLLVSWPVHLPHHLRRNASFRGWYSKSQVYFVDSFPAARTAEQPGRAFRLWLSPLPLPDCCSLFNSCLKSRFVHTGLLSIQGASPKSSLVSLGSIPIVFSGVHIFSFSRLLFQCCLENHSPHHGVLFPSVNHARDSAHSSSTFHTSLKHLSIYTGYRSWSEDQVGRLCCVEIYLYAKNAMKIFQFPVYLSVMSILQNTLINFHIMNH